MNRPPPNLERMRLDALRSLQQKAQTTAERSSQYRQNYNSYNNNNQYYGPQNPQNQQYGHGNIPYSNPYRFNRYGSRRAPPGPHRNNHGYQNGGNNNNNYQHPRRNNHNNTRPMHFQQTQGPRRDPETIIIDSSPSPEDFDDIVEIPPPTSLQSNALLQQQNEQTLIQSQEQEQSRLQELLPTSTEEVKGQALIVANDQVQNNPQPKTQATAQERSPAVLAAKLKEATAAVNDLRALGYNYYDLIVLAKIHPKFLDENFPELRDQKPSGSLKRTHDQISSTTNTPSNQPNMPSFLPSTPVMQKPVSHNTTVKPNVALTTTSSLASLQNALDILKSKSSTALPVSPKILTSNHETSQKENTATSIKPQTSTASITPTMSSVQLSTTSSKLQTTDIPKYSLPAPVHINKKVKFGGDRWSQSLNIVLSDSEDSDDEQTTSAPLTPSSSSGSSNQAKALREKIRLLQQKIEKAENSKASTPLNGLATPLSGTNTPPATEEAFRETPKERSVTPLALEITTKSRQVTPNSGLQAINSASVLRLKNEKETLDKYSKDHERIQKEMAECSAEIRQIDLEKVEHEVQELKLAYEKKMMEHVEKKIRAAITQTKLDSLKQSASNISNIILEVKANISRTEKEIQTELECIDTNEVQMGFKPIQEGIRNDDLDVDVVVPVEETKKKKKKKDKKKKKKAKNQAEKERKDDSDIEIIDVIFDNAILAKSEDSKNISSEFSADNKVTDQINLVKGDEPFDQNNAVNDSINQIKNLKDNKLPDLIEVESNTDLKSPSISSEHDDYRLSSPEPEEVMIHKETSPETKVSYFTPYESPLRIFRSFKFSPFFDETIPGGYKSLTYAQIPDEYICNNDFEEGGCKIPNCKWLHFKDIGSSDFTILNEMAKAFLGDTPEEIDEYRSGLVKMLTAQGESLDFDSTARASIKYRRSKCPDRFLDWHKFNSIKAKNAKTAGES